MAKKRVIENTTEHQIDVYFQDKAGATQMISVPRAMFVADGDNGKKKVNGRLLVDPKLLENASIKNDKVVKHFFTSGDLVDGGEVNTHEETEEVTE